jgi:GTP cyclohydrolase I
MIKYTLEQFNKDVLILMGKIQWDKYDSIYPVLQGGVALATILSEKTRLPLAIDYLSEKALVVDDLIDSGATRSLFPDNDFACLHVKRKPLEGFLETYYISEANDWISYWWEKDGGLPTDNVIRMLEYIGEDPKREGLLETPQRVIKAWDFIFSGYKEKPEDFIKTFDEKTYDEMVLLKDIEMYSMCEHHTLPFFGKAHVAYIPDKKVIGISKLARIVNMFSRRLQIQERLCQQIADCLMNELQPKGAACVIEAQHLCMKMRGVEKQNSVMVTSSLKGVFLEKISAREEFMRLIK